MSLLVQDLKAANLESNKLFLVGHSAGAIMICELLDTLFNTMGWTGKVVVLFLAPAATMSRFELALNQHAAKIEKFRMFTMTDSNERHDVLTQGILPDVLANAFYPSSLLYFISGVLERDNDVPLIGMDRYYRAGAKGQPPKSQVVLNYVLDATPPPRVAWSVNASTDPTINTNSLHHGGFGSPTFSDKTHNTTIDSIVAIVKTW